MVRVRNKTIAWLFAVTSGLMAVATLLHVFTFQHKDNIKKMKSGSEYRVTTRKISDDINEFMSKYRVIHEHRINHTRQMCKKYEVEIPKMTHLPHLLVNEKHKLVYCQIPKAGSTSWSRVFLHLKGYIDFPGALKLGRRQVNAAWKKNIPQVHDYPPEKQEEILKTYTKFMFVRHPFSRLLSAFNDQLKLKENQSLTAMQNQIGWRVIRKFRPQKNKYKL